MASSIYEATMRACLESKSADVKKKIASKKQLTESKKINRKRMIREADEDEVENSNEMSDVSDKIVAVIDPEIEADEMSEVAQAFQDIIDDTPDGEIPETDEYVGDSLYCCPVCGQTFFSADDMSNGGNCPICGEDADGFVLAGEVQSVNDAEDEVIDDEFADDEDIEDMDFDMDGEELDIDDEEVEENCKPKAKKVERKNIRRTTRRPSMEKRATIRRPSARRAVKPSMEKKATINRRSVKSVAEKRTVRNNELMLDEKTFNRYLTRFIRENYKNANTFTVVSAKKVRNNLKFECKIGFKSGKSKKVTLECKNFDKNAKTIPMRDNGAFKVESKKSANSPFVFKIAKKGNVIACEGMKYNFYTKAMKEGKLAQVYGSYLGESAKRRPTTRRAIESKSMRKPSIRSRRAIESRNMRRPTVRRTVENKAMRRPTTRRPMVEHRVARRPSTRK